MKRVEKCPVCVEFNHRDFEYCELGICEDYYTCKECGYFYTMAYSPVIEGIDVWSGRLKDRARKILLTMKHHNRIKGLNLKFMIQRA